MGKYMRKAKLTGDVVAVMDVSQSSLGVRTRAKTLALQKLQGQASKTAPPSPPSSAAEQDRELSYLQLRSRRLEKPPVQRLTCFRQQNPNPGRGNSRLGISSGVLGSAGSGSGSIDLRDQVLSETKIKADEKTEASFDLGAEEGSFGENNIDLDGRERSTRESTPCSLIRDSNAISTPGSSTRPTNLQASHRISIERSMPLAQDLEEFFARHELEQQRCFAEKYNFDVVNEKPLEGRYEWVRVQSE